MRTNGEPIFLQSDGMTGAINVYDANMARRPIAANERLVIDHITGDTAGFGVARVFADVLKNLTPVPGYTLCQFDDSSTSGSNNPFYFSGAPSGVSIPLGINIACTSIGAVVTGVGRVVSQTYVGRQHWQARLNA